MLPSFAVEWLNYQHCLRDSEIHPVGYSFHTHCFRFFAVLFRSWRNGSNETSEKLRCSVAKWRKVQRKTSLVFAARRKLTSLPLDRSYEEHFLKYCAAAFWALRCYCFSCVCLINAFRCYQAVQRNRFRGISLHDEAVI